MFDKKQWNRDNAEKLKVYRHRWYVKNKEKHRAWMAQYVEENREQIYASRTERRRRHKARGLDFLGNRCVRCGRDDKPLVFARIIPDPAEETMAHKWCLRWDLVLAELLEHELLCRSCHVKKRYE